MNLLEEKILKQFIKKEKGVQNLDLFCEIIEDQWQDNDYSAVVLERKDNGRVWTVDCTKNGKIIEIYEL